MLYKIQVKTVRNDILKYNDVESYQVIDGFVVFKDAKTGRTKRFACANVEIDEVHIQ